MSDKVLTNDGRIVPLVHLNGSSSTHLLEVYLAATQKVRDALEAMYKASPNARDYYPQGDDAFSQAVREHKEHETYLKKVLSDLEAVVEKIVEQDERAGR